MNNSDPLLVSEYCTLPHPGRPLLQYVLIIDAGSTGSRIHVFRFNYCKATAKLEHEVFNQIKPGLSSYANDPKAAARSLDRLLKVALENVPKSLHHCTPIAIKATAGLRLLGEEKSARILKAVNSHVRENYPFNLVDKSGATIMDGKDEGVYAWITVNYLLKNIGGMADRPTVAIFDLGGGSTQIVFEPTFELTTKMHEGEHQYDLKFGNQSHTLYQHSYLGYGLMEARRQMKLALVEQWNLEASEKNNSKDTMAAIYHPCLPSNYTESFSRKSDEQHYKIHGVAEGFKKCTEISVQILNKNRICPLKPCSFDGVYQPSLKETFGDNDLYLFSYFYDRTHPMGIPSKFTLSHIKEVAEKVCSGKRDYFAASKEALQEIDHNPHLCMDLSYMYVLLREGYGISESRTLHTISTIDGYETGWSLGAAIAVLDHGAFCSVTEH